MRTRCAARKSSAGAMVAVPPSSGTTVRSLTQAADQFIVERGDRRPSSPAITGSRLGPRHDDRVAGPDAGHRAARDRADILRAFAATSTRACCRTASPTRARRPSTTPSTPRSGSSKRSAQYLDYTGDARFVRDELFAVAEGHHRLAPARHPLRHPRRQRRPAVSGEPGVQLTWMDAKVGDWVVTPRTASRSRSRRFGTTRCASWRAWRAHLTSTSAAERYAELAARAEGQFQSRCSGTKPPAVSTTSSTATTATAPSARTRFSPSACRTRCWARRRRGKLSTSSSGSC